jgi:hypothetical protein
MDGFRFTSCSTILPLRMRQNTIPVNANAGFVGTGIIGSVPWCVPAQLARTAEL